MERSLTDTLCTRCGLCCDGSLFADVELASRAEATRLEVLGLEVEDGDPRGFLLVQPCRALKGTRCGIYAHRPGCCRTFECRLLQDVRHGATSVERAQRRIAQARERIGRVRDLVAQSGRRAGRLPLAEICAEALARDPERGPQASRTRGELEAAVSGLTAWLRRTFLAGATPARARGAGRRRPG